MTDKELKDWLNEHISLIEKKHLEELYYTFPETSGAALTDFFNANDINPLEYMEQVPIAYAKGSRTLKNVHIPSNIKKVEVSAFLSCTALERVLIDNGLRKIEGGGFENCPSLKEIIFPDSLEYLGSNCFEDCINLKTVSIGPNLRIIEDRAFATCTSLKDIQFRGTVDQWKHIEKGFDWHYDADREAQVTCVDGNIPLYRLGVR